MNKNHTQVTNIFASNIILGNIKLSICKNNPDYLFKYYDTQILYVKFVKFPLKNLIIFYLSVRIFDFKTLMNCASVNVQPAAPAWPPPL